MQSQGTFGIAMSNAAGPRSTWLTAIDMVQISHVSRHHRFLYNNILKLFEEAMVEVSEQWSREGVITTYSIPTSSGKWEAHYFDHAPVCG